MSSFNQFTAADTPPETGNSNTSTEAASPRSAWASPLSIKGVQRSASLIPQPPPLSLSPSALENSEQAVRTLSAKAVGGVWGGAPSSPAFLNSLTPPSSPTVATQFKGQSAQGVADAKAFRCREQAREAPRDPILRLYWKMAAVLDSASGAGSIALGVGAGAGATVGSGTSASVSSPLTRMSPASNAQRPATPTCPQVRRLPPQTEERGCQCSYIAWTA